VRKESGMRVLLLSRSRVVQELVKLGIKSLETVELEIVEEPSELQGDRYDLLLLDDGYLREFSAPEADHLIVGRRVLLGREERDAEAWDRVLPKPFLPGDIREILVEESPEPEEEEADLEAFLREELEREKETAVLDGEEIRRIRSLLDESPEEQPSGELSDLPEPEVSPERDRAYSVDEILDLLERVKVKKLRKVLQGATIRISIEFPEEG